MEPSATSDEEGESAGSFHFKIVVLVFIFLFACSKTHQKNKITISKTSRHTKSPARIDSSITAKPVKKKKKIYLTFDDGPNKGTRNVLDIVQQENIPVTFFIVGEHVFASRS